MAGTANDNQPFNSQLYLSPDQQDLLMAALNSNSYNQNGFGQDPKTVNRNGQMQPYGVDALNPDFFSSPHQGGSMQNLDGFGMDGSPFGDYLDGDASFDYDQSDPRMMIGNLPGDTPPHDVETEAGDKRKSPDEENDDDDEDSGAKRREGDDKTAKKPGRKPLTSEPTTKRKAQNRAAQRAFRERKEKHLKDLETKVAELEKASDATNHENGLLRAQVSRLQTELREYRKRMSLNSSSSLSRSPPIGGFASYMNGNNSQNNFQFEFPRFGGLPGTQMFNNGPLAKSGSTSSTPARSSSGGPGVLLRQTSGERSLSPRSQSTNSVVNSPAGINSVTSNGSTGAANRSSNNVASNGNAKRSSTEASNGTSEENTAGQSRVFQFKPGSVSSTTNSPSASSTSHFGGNSSACTSPDAAQNSPAKMGDTNMDSIKEGYVCHGNSEGEIAFCEKLNMACGNPRNPVPRAMSVSNGSVSAANKSPNMEDSANNVSTPATSNNPKTPNAEVNGIDHLASQNGGQFDPILFGDYRESQAAVVGDGDFTNGFFNDAFVMPDFGSPFQVGETPAIQKPNPLEEIEKLQDGGDEEVVPGEDTTQMLNCHSIWDKLSARPDFQEGSFDIDGLCSDLRAKARCSESGVVVDKKDVDAALLRAREKERQLAAQ